VAPVAGSTAFALTDTYTTLQYYQLDPTYSQTYSSPARTVTASQLNRTLVDVSGLGGQLSPDAVNQLAAQLAVLAQAEAALAVDQVFATQLQSRGMNIAGLQAVGAVLQTAITQDPTYYTTLGRDMGQLAYDLTLDLLETAQRT
jgi:hypothetical protein